MSAAAAAASAAAISSSYSSSSNSISNHYHHQLNYHNFHTTYQFNRVSRFYYNGPAPGGSAPVKRMVPTPATVESEPVLDTNTKFLEEEKVPFAGQVRTPRRKKEKSEVLRWWKAMSGCLMALSRRNAKGMRVIKEVRVNGSVEKALSA